MKSTDRYNDIMQCTPPRAAKPMARVARAAQFAPFAALVGHDAAIAETARLTDRRIPLDDESARRLNETLARLSESVAAHPSVTVVYFVPDSTKEGGAYVTYHGVLRRVDETARQLHFVDRFRIAMEDIYTITCENNFTFSDENAMIKQRGDDA